MGILLPDLRGDALSLSPLSMMFAVGFFYIAFIMLSSFHWYFLSNGLEILYWNILHWGIEIIFFFSRKLFSFLGQI